MSELRGRDARLDALAGRLEILFFLVVPVLAFEAYRSTGLERLLLAPTALVLLLMLLLHRFAGVPGHALLRWLGGGVGVVLGLAGLVGIVAGVWLLTLGSFAILGGMVLVPVSVAFMAMGHALFMVALNAQPKGRPLDLSAARHSDAVRRFDALHGPGRKGDGGGPPVSGPGPSGAGLPDDGVDGTVPGS